MVQLWDEPIGWDSWETLCVWECQSETADIKGCRSFDMKSAAKRSTGGEAGKFKLYLQERIKLWVQGSGTSNLAQIDGVDESIWEENEDIVCFPTTISQKQRKIIHNICADLSVFHISIGDQALGTRFIAISKSGDFSKLIAESDSSNSDVNYSIYYNASISKPVVVSAFESMLSHDKIEFHRNFVNSICTEFGGVAPNACLEIKKPSSSVINTDPVWIDNEAQLEAFVLNNLNESNCKVFAFDCEMHSYRSYQGLTCLIQIRANNCDYIIDCISLWKVINKHLGPAFADARIVKVGHATSSMDIPCLYRDFGIIVVNLFDTQQAAFHLGHHPRGPPSIGAVLRYYNLFQQQPSNQAGGVAAIEEFSRIKSTYQSTDWRIRPLTDEMMRYVQMDVHYLVDVYFLQILELIAMDKDNVLEHSAGSAAVVSVDTDCTVSNEDNDYFEDEQAESGMEGTDWDQTISLEDIQIGDTGLNDDDDEALWDGWGDVNSCSNVTPPATVSSTIHNQVSREEIVSNPLYCHLHAVLSASSKSCSQIWSIVLPSLADVSEVEYRKCSIFKDFKKKCERPDSTTLADVAARTEYIFQYLFIWREKEAIIRDESPDFICAAHLLLAVAIKLPTTESELSILASPLPYSMRTTSIDMLLFRETEEIVSIPPVNIVEAVKRAIESWNVTVANAPS